MKRILVAVLLALTATSAAAYCYSNTIVSEGRVIVCTVCCVNNNCTTTCF